MILISLLIFFFCIYYEKILSIFYNSKNSRNLVAATHAYLSVILHSYLAITYPNESILNLSYCISIGYFLYDIYYIFKYEKLNILRGMYIYHHFASICLLLNNKTFNNTSQLILLAEISNLPSYTIYYYLHDDNYIRNKSNHNGNNISIINFCKIIQKILYFFIRIFLMTIILVNMVLNLDFSDMRIFTLACLIFPVYIMGILWSTILIYN